MDNSRLEKGTSLKELLNSFADSYEGRDQTMGFSDWLADRLSQEMPRESGRELAGEIIEGIAGYDKTLAEVNAAINSGQSKEEWFAEYMSGAYSNMPLAVVGEKLQQLENSYIASNRQLMKELGSTQADDISVPGDGVAEWNEYSIKDKVYKIGKQVFLVGIGAAANVIRENIEDGQSIEIESIVKGTLQDGVKKAPAEIKAVVAGAVKVAAIKGLEGRLPEDTPTETICDMAGVAVEGAEALYDVANGDCTMTDALDKVGRAGVAAGCRYCAACLKAKLLLLPYGALLADLLGGLLDHMNGPKFTQNVYTVVRDAAVATWEGVKSSIRKKSNKVKNILFG